MQNLAYLASPHPITPLSRQVPKFVHAGEGNIRKMEEVVVVNLYREDDTAQAGHSDRQQSTSHTGIGGEQGRLRQNSAEGKAAQTSRWRIHQDIHKKRRSSQHKGRVEGATRG